MLSFRTSRQPSAFNMQINKHPLAEQKDIYENYKTKSKGLEAAYLTEADCDFEPQLVDAEATLKNLEFFEHLWTHDYQLVANKKRLAELKHVNHKELIDVNLMTKFRLLSNDVSTFSKFILPQK